MNACNELILRCYLCDKLNSYTISLFTLEQKPKEYKCTCGMPILSLQKEKMKIHLKIKCSHCEQDHDFLINQENFLNNNALSIYCDANDFLIAFLGKSENFTRNYLFDLQSILKKRENSKESVSEACRQTLEKISEFRKKEKFYCCCGNESLTIEFFDKSIDICCEVCGATGIIYLNALDGKQSIYSLQDFILKEGSCSYYFQ